MTDEIDAAEIVEIAEIVDGETPREAFKRLANYRKDRAIMRMRQMHKLGSTRYDYELRDVDLLCKILRDEVTKLENALLGVEDDVPQL